MQTRGDLGQGVDPSYAKLTPHQHLEHALQISGMRGVVFGQVMSDPQSLVLPDVTGSLRSRPVSEARFKVSAFYGGQRPFYAVGSFVTVLASAPLEGGTPRIPLSKNELLMIFVQDQPIAAPAGPLTSEVLAVSSYSNVATVTADQRVVSWGQLVTSMADFTQTLQAHPAPGQ